MAAPLFAVADLHGDLQQAQRALRLCGLLSQAGMWSAGNATLVQTGDLVDRGANSVAVLSLFRMLETQASAQGGSVVRLLGNHEVINMEGDHRYVAPAEVIQVGGPSAWGALFDPVSGALGSVLRHHHAAALAGSGACRTLFVHAGLLPEMLRPPGHYAQGGAAVGGTGAALLADLDRRMRAALGRAREPDGRFAGLTGDDGPVWYRGFAQGTELRVCAALRSTLQSVGAWRMVVGHTITPDHTYALPRCGGLLHMIDVGMSSAYYGSLAAWTCEPRRTGRYPGAAAVEDGGSAVGAWASSVPLYARMGIGDASRAPPLQTVFRRLSQPSDPMGADHAVADGDEALAGGTLVPWTLEAGRTRSLSAEARRAVGPTMQWLARECLSCSDCLGLSVEGATGLGGGKRRGAAAAPPAVFWWRKPGSAAQDPLSSSGPRAQASDLELDLEGLGGSPPSASQPWWAQLLSVCAVCLALGTLAWRVWRWRQVAAGRYSAVARPRRSLSRSASAVSVGRIELGDEVEDDYHSE